MIKNIEKKPLISIIVPVYNVEVYLDNCILKEIVILFFFN